MELVKQNLLPGGGQSRAGIIECDALVGDRGEQFGLPERVVTAANEPCLIGVDGLAAPGLFLVLRFLRVCYRAVGMVRWQWVGAEALQMF